MDEIWEYNPTPRTFKIPYPFTDPTTCRWCNGKLTGRQKNWDKKECGLAYAIACGYFTKKLAFDLNDVNKDGIVACKSCHKDVDYKNSEVDHIRPLALGGTNDPENMQVLCWDCHYGKTNHDYKLIKYAKKARGVKRLEKFGFEFGPR